MSRLDRDDWGLWIAAVTAERGTCLRRRVGCVLLNERGHVLSTGYNGVAAGVPHCNERLHVPIDGGLITVRFPYACDGADAPSGTGLERCDAIHAEANALLQCRDVWAIDTVCVTASPCRECVKLLTNTSARRVVFREVYPHADAEVIWKASLLGREWVHRP